MEPEVVQRLYPTPNRERPLRGCYLDHDLRSPTVGDRPFIYTNFITSLDGRVADRDPVTGRKRVPPLLANPRDWRLYLELVAQADVVLTTAKHLRAVVRGRAGTIFDSPECGDLREWRVVRGLAPTPILAVITRGLDLPLAELGDRAVPLMVLTGAGADRRRVAEIARRGTEVIDAGAGAEVEGGRLPGLFAQRGLRVVCSVCGPAVLNSLLAADAIDRIYLTVVIRLLGDAGTEGLLRGGGVAAYPGFRLLELYRDASGAAEAEQLFLSLVRESQREARGAPLWPRLAP